MSTLEDFQNEIERFLQDTGMKPTEFGQKAMNDPSFVGRVRGGREHRITTIDRVRDFMAEHREAAESGDHGAETVAAHAPAE